MNPRFLVGPTRWPFRLGRWPVRLSITLATVLAPSCAPRQIIVERAPQAYYQTSFPLHDTSRDLDRVHEAVKRIHYSAEYQTFVFSRESAVTLTNDVLDPAVLAMAVDTFTETDSKSGSASIIGLARRGVALLTNHHVVYYPPVRVRFFDEELAADGNHATQRHVSSISIRTRERGILADHLDVGAFEVLARDTVNDLAIIEARLREESDTSRFSIMPVPPGDPNRLSWGSFVYTFGYPRGYPMVTFGIVSHPDRDRQGAFLTNSLWNEGISGGAIFAIRGETGSLEWVGIARAGAGAEELRVQPPAGRPILDDDMPVVYQGPLLIESVLRIQYGITFSVPMTVIRRFLSENRRMLASRGYDVRIY